MSQENVEIVQRAYKVFDDAGFSGAAGIDLGAFDADIEAIRRCPRPIIHQHRQTGKGWMSASMSVTAIGDATLARQLMPQGLPSIATATLARRLRRPPYHLA